MLEQPLCLTLSKTTCHYSSMPNEVSSTFHMALTQTPHIEGTKSYELCAGRRYGGCWPAIDDSLPRRQRDGGAALCTDDRPPPFHFFRRPNGHDQVDGALAQTPEEDESHIFVSASAWHLEGLSLSGAAPFCLLAVLPGAPQVIFQPRNGPDALAHPQAHYRSVVADGKRFVCSCRVPPLFLPIPESPRSRYSPPVRLGQLA